MTRAWLLDYVVPAIVSSLPVAGVSLFSVLWQGRKTRRHTARELRSQTTELLAEMKPGGTPHDS